jgi:hypothetical protein
MNHEDIIKLAREAGIYGTETSVATTFDDLEDFAALVAAKEREECAKVCDQFDAQNPYIGQGRKCAKIIRARGMK